MTMPVVNPFTERAFETVETDDDMSVVRKYVRACRAQRDWAKTALEERLRCLRTFSTLLRGEANEVARTLTLEMGKPITQARAEVLAASHRVRVIADAVAEAVAPRTVHRSGAVTERVEFEPVGVVANVSAWNYPHLLAANVFGAALATGNAVLLKPSEITPLSGAHVARLLHQAGVPEDVFQVTQGGASVGRTLVQLRGLGAVAFTGSRATGRAVARAVVDGLGSDDRHPLPPRMIMELGGKDAVYVRADVADPAAAAASVSHGVASIANGAFYNAGQGCCAVERIYVHEAVARPFIEAFVRAAEGFARGMGDPTDPGTTLGPLAQAGAPRRIAAQVEAAVAGGAEILFRGDAAVPPTGYFAPPTVVGGAALRGAQGAHALLRDESFGPVVAIVVVEDDAEAVEAMGDTSYGLTAGVYTADEEAALRILRGLDVGTGYWNACNHVSPRLPWTGRLGSGGGAGGGATLGLEGIGSFVKPKSMYLRAA